jgi:hypothetical protein
MKTMKRILAAALVAAVLVGGLGAGLDVKKVQGCKPGLFPKGNELAGNKRDRQHHATAVLAVRG